MRQIFQFFVFFHLIYYNYYRDYNSKGNYFKLKKYTIYHENYCQLPFGLLSVSPLTPEAILPAIVIGPDSSGCPNAPAIPDA